MPKTNQVYVKIILPFDPAKGDKDRPRVESWIAEELKKRGQTKFTSATAWVRLADKAQKLRSPTEVWDGVLDGKSLGVCPVDGRISGRADHRVTIFLDGNIGWKKVTVSLADEAGDRAIAAVEITDAETEQVRPFAYVALLIGPPAPTDSKK